MTTKHYNISLNQNRLNDCYRKFIFIDYKIYIQKMGDHYLFDFQDVAMILDPTLTNEEQLKRKSKHGVNNFDLIGAENNIKKVVKDIKSKGFTLEEIVNNLK